MATIFNPSNETFAGVDSGASLTYPKQCSALRNGGFVLLKGNPCKILEMSVSKTGKHGGAKINFVAVDIFSGKKHEAFIMSTDTIEVPHVARTEYQLVNIDDEGFLALYDENGKAKCDLRLGTSATDLELQKAFEAGKDLLVTIQSAMGKEAVFSFKEDKAA